MGTGTITDCLAAVKYNVYDHQNFTMAELLSAMKDNFQGHDRILNLVRNKTPKYGNDNDYADGLMRKVFNYFVDSVSGRPNMRGGTYQVDNPGSSRTGSARSAGCRPPRAGQRSGSPPPCRCGDPAACRSSDPITLKESSTYTDFANINTGGVTPEGEDGVNEVSYIILDCMDDLQLVQPNSNVHWHSAASFRASSP